MLDNSSCIMEMRNVCKLYGQNHSEAKKMLKKGISKTEVHKKTGCMAALWDVSLRIPRGKIFVIIGLSGSGKSTAVRCFNNLTVPTSGQVFYEGMDVCKMNKEELLRLKREKISMVFQSFGLMEHRGVLSNVAFGLEVKGVSREEREQTARKYLAMVGLNGWEHRACSQLSGGMRQRVGIARALASGSEVLLMDEPFSALDPLVRRDMQYEFLRIQRKLKKTIVFITHDMDEAFKMGDIVCIMKGGRVVQIGTPEELTVNPASDYVRDFISSADQTKVITVSNIMITPSCLVRLGDGVEHAIHEMRINNLSSVVVVDEELRLKGILSVREAIAGRTSKKSIAELVDPNMPRVSPNTLIADIIPVAADMNLPIGVVDEENVLLGLVTKASILSSFI